MRDGQNKGLKVVTIPAKRRKTMELRSSLMPSNLQHSLALMFILIVGGGGIVFLTLLYRDEASRPAHFVRRIAKGWEFTAEDLGGFSWFRLAGISALSLFLEMLLIRWVASEVPVFAYFKNIALIGCFFGFGLGYCFCRRTVNWLAFALPPFLLVFLIHIPWEASRFVIQQIPYRIGQTSEFELFGRSISSTALADSLLAMLLILFFFLLVAFAFVPLGQLVGWHLESAGDGILAYTLNVMASIAGIALYTLLCFHYQPPVVWFALAGTMATMLLWKLPRIRWTTVLLFSGCLAFLCIGPPKPSYVLWSPYQKITVSPIPNDREPTAYRLETNGAWYQEIINLSPDFVLAHPELFKSVPAEANAYNIPYHFYPKAPAVLVLGAGTGNDVAAALRNNADRVVAVEIDPLILDIGRKLHFERPYDSPRVHIVLNDARSYIHNSHDKFNLIVFSLLDSHTNASYYSNIRIDDYVYTLEAFQAAKRLLTPDGVFVVKFWVSTPWIAGRLYSLVNAAFGQAPLDLNAVRSDYTTVGRFFIAGSEQRIHDAMNDPTVRPYVIHNRISQAPSTTLTTDDWPYFYQQKRTIPHSIVILSIMLTAACWILLRRTGVGVSTVSWHFFFLGAGFMLLEVQVVSKMALLFGTTWLVNSLVVGGVLLLIASANLVVRAVPVCSRLFAYVAMFLSLVVIYFTPIERFSFSNVWLKAVSATGMLCLPVFFASVIFIQSFADARFDGRALGSNLFGALFGGLLECISLWTGIRFLILVAGILYAASYLFLRRHIAGPISIGDGQPKISESR